MFIYGRVFGLTGRGCQIYTIKARAILFLFANVAGTKGYNIAARLPTCVYLAGEHPFRLGGRAALNGFVAAVGISYSLRRAPPPLPNAHVAGPLAGLRRLAAGPMTGIAGAAMADTCIIGGGPISPSSSGAIIPLRGASAAVRSWPAAAHRADAISPRRSAGGRRCAWLCLLTIRTAPSIGISCRTALRVARRWCGIEPAPALAAPVPPPAARRPHRRIAGGCMGMRPVRPRWPGGAVRRRRPAHAVDLPMLRLGRMGRRRAAGLPMWRPAYPPHGRRAAAGLAWLALTSRIRPGAALTWPPGF